MKRPITARAPQLAFLTILLFGGLGSGCKGNVPREIPPDAGAADAGVDAAPDGGCTGPTCPSPLGWVHQPATIDDATIVGNSLSVPIDGVSFGYDPMRDLFMTGYGRSLFDPTTAFLWFFDPQSERHYRLSLLGDAFSETENFCVSENWCQLIGFDPQAGDWLIAGPAASALLRIDAQETGTLVAVSGASPPPSWINHAHRFDWTTRALVLYGATGPSGFGDIVFRLDLDRATWTQPAQGLPEVTDNCIVVDGAMGFVYTFAGRQTTDGGNSSTTLDTYQGIDLAGGPSVSGTLPAPLGARRSLSCAFDPTRRLVYLFGGARVVDRFDEILNEYFNDLWVYDVDADTFTEVMAPSVPGTFDPPDQFGDQRFVGDPAGPNFGQNRGYLQLDAAGDRLLIIGSIPPFTHEQAFALDLGGLDALLGR